MNKKKLVLTCVAVGLGLLLAVAAVFAQDSEVDDEGIYVPQKLQVTKGAVELDGVKYLIYTKVKEVEVSQIGGVSYFIETKTEKTAIALAKKINTFYKGKTMNGVKLPAFKKVGKPETIGWYSFKCVNEKGVQVIVKVSDNFVGVYLVPEPDACDESIQAMIM